jgi:hypothetical protein
VATIDRANTTMTTKGGVTIPLVFPFVGRVDVTLDDPTVTPTALVVPLPVVGTVNLPVGFYFQSPTIDANASMRLRGNPGENVAGWTLGFVQLKYIGTNQSRYRGATPRDGSTFVTGSNQTVCRDTDTPPAGTRPEVWYDSFAFGGTTGPKGTNRLAAGTTLPASGFLDVPAHLFDRPARPWPIIEPNGVVRGRPYNYLQHSETELLFCTLLVARDPAGKFHTLMHFYWNVVWEWLFKLDGSGRVVEDRALRKGHNIQPVQTGNPMDAKFQGKEFDLNLPVSNVVSRKPPTKMSAADWRHQY